MSAYETEGVLLARLQRARLKKEQGDARAAIVLYRQIVQDRPDYRPACIELARLLIETNRHEEAGDLLRRYLKNDPNDSEANFLMGVVLYVLGDFEGALRYYEVCRRAEGLDISLAVNIALCYEALGDYQKTAQFLQVAVNQKASNPRVWEALIDTYHHLRRHSDEARVAEAALRIFPRNQRLLYLAARAHIQRGNHTAAVARLTKLLSLSPENTHAIRLLAHCLIELRHYDEALAYLKDLVSIEPYDAENWLNLVQMHLALGAKEAAVKTLKLALAKYLPEEPSLKAMLESITERGEGGDGGS